MRTEKKQHQQQVCQEQVCQEQVCQEQVCQEQVCQEQVCQEQVCQEQVCQEQVCQEQVCQESVVQSSHFLSDEDSVVRSSLRFSDQSHVEPWSVSQEELLTRWRRQCEELVTEHIKAAKKKKLCNSMAGLPAMAIPLVMAPVTAVIDDDVYEHMHRVEMVAFIITGVCSGLLQFFRFAEKSTKHFNAASRYEDCITDIDAELARPRQYRVRCDLFCTKIKMSIDNLSHHCPPL